MAIWLAGIKRWAGRGKGCSNNTIIFRRPLRELFIPTIRQQHVYKNYRDPSQIALSNSSFVTFYIELVLTSNSMGAHAFHSNQKPDHVITYPEVVVTIKLLLHDDCGQPL
jgi:hypothetical protein